MPVTQNSKNSRVRRLRTFEIEIPGNPIAKTRPRFVSRGRDGQPLPFVKTYDDQDKIKKDLQKFVQWTLKKDYPFFKPFDCPIHLTITFRSPVQNAAPKCKKRALFEQKITWYHAKMPDLSNMIKFYEDCLNGILWEDDRLIVEIYSFKIYAETPGTLIIINELEQPDWEFWKGYFTGKGKK